MSRPMADTPKRRARRRSSPMNSKQQRGAPGARRGQDVSARRPRSRSDRDGAARVGQAGAGGSLARAHGPDDRRARGAGAAPQSTADRARRARHLKKSHGVLREAEPVRFAFIAAKKAEHPCHDPLPVYAGDPQWVLRVAATRAVGAGAARSSSCARNCARSMPPAAIATGVRACGRTCRRTAKPSAKSA